MSQPMPRTQMSRILLLTDLQPKTQSALSYARAFATYYSAELLLVHMIAESDPLRPARHALDMLAATLRADGLTVHTHMREATPLPEVALDQIRRLAPDLVVQGTAGIDDLRRAFLGSTAEAVFRQSPVPVLTVPERVIPYMKQGLCFPRMLLMTDFGANSRAIASYALSLAQEFNSHITLAHVHPPGLDRDTDREAKRAVEETLSQFTNAEIKNWCEPSTAVESGDPEVELAAFLIREKPDLVVLGAHPPGLLGTHGRPGFAVRVVSRASCPVLTLFDKPGSGASMDLAVSDISILD